MLIGRFVYGLLSVLLISGLFLFGSNPKTALADINSCSAQVFQHSAAQGSVANFQFQVNNSDSNAIAWIKITRPSDNFSIYSADASGWNADSNSEAVTFWASNINPGDSYNQIYIGALASSATPPVNWSVQVSDDSSGANPFNCSGDLGTTVTGPAPTIADIAISNISSSSIIIGWNTDVPATTQVNYGPDDSYGRSSQLDSNLVTSHTVKLSNLSANTSYHFQVVSATPDGGTTNSGDNTFLTAVSENTSPKLINTSSPISTPIPIKAVPTEKIPPGINFKTKFVNPYKEPPKIAGSASDNEALAGIEYSIDNGKNWLPVDSEPGLGGKKVDFYFTPLTREDGNYQLLVRAIDTSGNIGKTDPIVLVIDRLPPLVGGTVINIGPEILQPGQNGVVSTLVGIDQKITLSAVGGPTKITINATSRNSKIKAKSFSLTKSQDTGLWSGILSFENAGVYTLIVNSIDGAGNKTAKTLSTTNVLAPAKIVNKNNQPVAANVTVYYLQPDSNDWVIWDGASYNQHNPQKSNGTFNFLLPAGKYYIKATAKGYKNVTTDILKLANPTPISTTLNMDPRGGLSVGPLNMSLPDFSNEKANLGLSHGSFKNSAASMAGKSIPTFSLNNSSGNKINSVDWLGKPTILSFLSTWSPTTSDQTPALQGLQQNRDINVIPIGFQDNSGRLQAYSSISGQNLKWLADPDSSLSNYFNVASLPTHYFIDRKGVVKQVVTGLLSKESLSSGLSGL